MATSTIYPYISCERKVSTTSFRNAEGVDSNTIGPAALADWVDSNFNDTWLGTFQNWGANNTNPVEQTTGGRYGVLVSGYSVNYYELFMFGYNSTDIFLYKKKNQYYFSVRLKLCNNG